MSHTHPWRDEDTLREMYNDQKMSQSEIADAFGINQPTVSKWMGHFGISTRDPSTATALAHGPLDMYTSVEGYEEFTTRINYERKAVLHHRLLAVAECGFSAVEGRVVHHKNGVKWDNRPENIEVLSDSRHKEIHANQRERTNRGEFA